MGSRICGCWSQLTACACSPATDSTSRLHPSPYGAGLSGLCISSDFCCLKISPQMDLYKRLKNFPPVLISSSMVLTLPQPCKRRLSVVYKIPQRLTRARVRLGLHPREWISRVYTVWGDLVPFSFSTTPLAKPPLLTGCVCQPESVSDCTLEKVNFHGIPGMFQLSCNYEIKFGDCVTRCLLKKQSRNQTCCQKFISSSSRVMYFSRDK